MTCQALYLSWDCQTLVTAETAAIIGGCAAAWIDIASARYLRHASDFWANQCVIFSTHLMHFSDGFREAVEEAIEAGERHPIMKYHRRFSHLEQFPEALRHAPQWDEESAKAALELELEENPHDPGEGYRRLLWRIFGGPDANIVLPRALQNEMTQRAARAYEEWKKANLDDKT